MDFKKLYASLGRFSAWVGLSVCSLIVRVVPAACLYSFARGVAFLGYNFVRKQRRLALEGLGFAFGAEKSPQEKESIARECFIDMSKSALELMFMMDKPGLLKSAVSLGGREHLDRALAKDKGVILVSAHFGNFPLLLSRLSQEGYRVAGIMRPMRDARVERIFLAKRRRYGVKTIYSQPRAACVEETIRALRNNEIVFIPIDQNFGSGGVFVDFFGRKAATATGPVVLAQRTGAAIIPCFIVRGPAEAQEIILEPELELREGSSQQETVAINIQKLTDIIELYIRRYPAQWGWMHRRWKTQKG